MARDCTTCEYIIGDECILYTGPSYPSCGLVPNTWYKVSDLIDNLLCAANGGVPVTTTTTTTTSSTTTTTSTVPPTTVPPSTTTTTTTTQP